MGLGRTVQKASSTIATLGAAGTAIAGCLVWGEDGRLQQFKIGPLAIFDRQRWDARHEARKARKAKKRAQVKP